MRGGRRIGFRASEPGDAEGEGEEGEGGSGVGGGDDIVLEIGTDDGVAFFVAGGEDEGVGDGVEVIERGDAFAPGDFVGVEPGEGVVDFSGIGSVGGDDVVAAGLELDGVDIDPA
ncbi:MAG: hypothetical protein RI897_3549 [Verrucomicrobiota bacterium]